MDENASYVDAIIENQEAIDAYGFITTNLIKQETSDQFIEFITYVLIFAPSLIELENILYIIDDRKSRHPNLAGVSGRDILYEELQLMSNFDDYPEALIDFYQDKYDIGTHSPQIVNKSNNANNNANNNNNMNNNANNSAKITSSKPIIDDFGISTSDDDLSQNLSQDLLQDLSNEYISNEDISNEDISNGNMSNDDDLSNGNDDKYKDRYELLSVLLEINHAYMGCFELRNFVSDLHKLKSKFIQSKPK